MKCCNNNCNQGRECPLREELDHIPDAGKMVGPERQPKQGDTMSHDPSNPLAKQVDGGHYKDLKIQPIEYIHANKIPFAEGCAIKYLTRWRAKGGIRDLEKAKHCIELLIELELRQEKP